MLISILFRGYFWNDFGRAIRFISQQNDINVPVTIVIGLRNPELFDVLQGAGVCNIVHHDDSIGSLVVGGRDGSESLLSGGVPNLELYVFVIVFEGFEAGVRGDGTGSRRRWW